MIEQLRNVAIVLKRANYTSTQEMRETAAALNWVANQIDGELAKKNAEADTADSTD